MLVDDNPDDNFYHEREIKKYDPSIVVTSKPSGKEALDYLRSINEGSNLQPDLIFLDINMPGMNGWDFLKEFDLLDKKIQSSCLIVMLTSSDDPADLKRVRSWSFVSGFITKPLSKSIVSNIIEKYF